ncbi:hypothetical protein Hanom_Chr09g00832891 [Helianthus anomalus]
MTMRLPTMNKTLLVRKNEHILGRVKKKMTLKVAQNGGYHKWLEQNKVQANVVKEYSRIVPTNCCLLCFLIA